MTDQHLDTCDAGSGDAEDGRRARRERNREAVVDAMLALYRDGNLAPSSDEIAERAGLSPRSLFRYFDDLDDLARTAIVRQSDSLRPLLEIGVPADGPLDVRVRALVAQRVQLFDAMGSVGQVTRLRAPFRPLIADHLRQARAYLRHQIERLFARELDAMAGSRGATALAAADVLCSYESYRLLRHDQSLSRPGTIDVLVDSLTLLFTVEDS
jgi:AcrR family transcriptional regulator